MSSYIQTLIDAKAGQAKEEGWVVQQNHCIARILLDHWCQACWYDVLDVRAPALAQLPDFFDAAALEADVEKLDAGNAAVMQRQSLRYRQQRLQVGDTAIIQVGNRRVRRGETGVVSERRLHTAHLWLAGREEVFRLRSLRDAEICAGRSQSRFAS